MPTAPSHSTLGSCNPRPATRRRTARTLGRLAALITTLAAVASFGFGSEGAAATQHIDATETVYAGVYSAEFYSSSDYQAIAQAAGTPMTFGGTFHHPLESEGSNWEHNTETLLEEVWKGQATPFANLEVTVDAHTIASGAYDTEIRAWAGRVKGWLDRGGGRSLFVAPLQEMNGDWVAYGTDPVNFIAAFHRIRDIFEAQGMDETQIRWVFAPNGWSTPPYSQADYYPGDAYVDVIGFSTYNFGDTIDRWASVPEVMGGVFDEARTYAPDKPYVLAQVASSTHGGDRDAWLNEMFAFITADPNAVGFVYFNLDRETDWRIWDGNQLADGFATGMTHPSVAHLWPMTAWFSPGALPFGPRPHPLPRIPDDLCATAEMSDITFSDVTAGAYYTDSVTWAANAGIATGYIDGTFRPGDTVTRAQAAVFLWRLACQPLVEAGTPFDDIGDGLYYSAAVDWLATTGITTGTGTGFEPHTGVSRGQMAAMLHRLAGRPSAPDATFGDIGEQYYADAVGWLEHNSIASGYPDGDYHPDDAVTRAQMVTFLDRLAH